MANLRNQEPNSSTNQDPAKELFTVEQLAQRTNVPGWALAGAKVAYGWGEGKEMTEAEFKKAVDKWLNGPMNRNIGKEEK